MNQRELNHEVARITGESSATIAAMGFSLVDMSLPAFDLRRQLRRSAPRRSFQKSSAKAAGKRSGAKPRKGAEAKHPAGAVRRLSAKRPGGGKVLRPRFIHFMDGAGAPSGRGDVSKLAALTCGGAPKPAPMVLTLDFDRPEGA